MPVDNEVSAIPSGLRLIRALIGHKAQINRIAWSPDGERIASPSAGKEIGIWDAKAGKLIRMLKGHTHIVREVAWSPNCTFLASASDDDRIKIWDANSGELIREIAGHTSTVLCIAWSPDGKILATSSHDSSFRLWDADSGKQLHKETGWFTTLTWSPDGHALAASGGDKKDIKIWTTEVNKFTSQLTGHSGIVNRVVWSPDDKFIASASSDRTIRIWDAQKGKLYNVLEGPTGSVVNLSFSHDARLLASRSGDSNVRIWRCDTWEEVAALVEPGSPYGGLAFHPHSHVLATLSENAKDIRIWKVNIKALLNANPGATPIHYTNAKVVLVGDTGVGKTGLGLALTQQPFVPTESTHGRHIWTIENKEVNLPDGRIETRETLLWDLAGQPGYRLIHQLHLNEVALALVVFDARSETDPFAGVRHWERALRLARRLQHESAMPLKKILIAARADRGGIGVSKPRIESLMRDLEFDRYFETSAKEGWGVKELVEAIHQGIDWEAMPKVSSNELFHRIKNFLLSEKKSGRLLSTIDDLYFTFIKSSDDVSRITNLRAQFDTCVGRVESRGLIKRLSFGNLILLQPEMLDAYASSIVNAAKEEPDGLGCISEEDARIGRFRISDDERIPNQEQEKLLLLATIENMLLHEIALREHAEDGTVLVFPSQLTREHPDFPDPQGKAVVFNFEGPVLSIYATLAVRLSHSSIFKKKGMWKNAATFSTLRGGICGFFLRELKEGEGELTLFFDQGTSSESQYQFEEYVSTHLQRRALPETIKRRKIFACSICSETVTDNQVKRRLERGFKTISCPVCESEISLTDEIRTEAQSPSVIREIDRAANAQREFDAGLVSAAGEMRTQNFRKWAGASSATIALVFTDIVDSTTLNNDLGDEAMNRLRKSHFQQARRLLGHYDGHEIKTIGDSLMIAFRTTVNAFDFALSFFSRTGSDRIKVRVGIHVGAVHIDEEDAFGAMVNYASRVTSSCKDAEIWVSSAAKNDIDQEKAQRHSELNWKEHPDCELKGFSGKYLLWSVNPQELKDDSKEPPTRQRGKNSTR